MSASEEPELVLRPVGGGDPVVTPTPPPLPPATPDGPVLRTPPTASSPYNPSAASGADRRYAAALAQTEAAKYRQEQAKYHRQYGGGGFGGGFGDEILEWFGDRWFRRAFFGIIGAIIVGISRCMSAQSARQASPGPGDPNGAPYSQSQPYSQSGR